MGRLSHLCACATAFVVLALGVPALAEAALTPISGRLDKPGYTVIALAASGAARTAVAPDGRFSLVPPAEPVTLHLRAPDGTYAGPIVVAPRTVRVRVAQAQVAATLRRVTRAELAVSAARRRLRRARGEPAKRRAARLLSQAGQRLTTARRGLSDSKQLLADSRLAAITLPQAQTQVAAAGRKVTQAQREASAAQRSLRRARGGSAKRRAARLLGQARQRLTRARRQLTQANQRLAAKQRLLNQAILGVKAGARLGAIEVKAAAGYALSRVDAQARRTSIDGSRTAQAGNGVPIGAGNFGLVRSARTDGAAVKDLDLDGVPDPLDIDDDGDLILDGYDEAAQARAAQAAGGFPDGSRLDINADLLTFDFPPVGPVNVNGGSTDAQIAEAQTLYGELTFFWFADDGTAELDCGSLPYCRVGGSGRIPPPQNSIFRSQGRAFPECCDADGDGLGTLTQAGRAAGFGPGSGAMTLWHGATIDQIDAGDVLIARGNAGGVPFESAKTVGFVFSTAPVLAAYDDGQGHAAAFTYPRPSPTPDTPVKAGPNGDIVLSLALWRPQRERLADEPGSGRWMDIGHLVYYVSVFVSQTEGASCPTSSLSSTDADLTPTQLTPSPGIEAGGFVDRATDQPPSPANTVAFTLNLTQCLAAKGAALDPGETARVNFHAVTATGRRAEARSDVPLKPQP